MGNLTVEKKLSLEEKLNGKNPYVQIFREVLQKAHQIKASDIHIEPTKTGIDIRLRLNGDLSTYKKLDKTYQQGFIREVKSLSELSIAISNKAQDSRISLPSWKLDLRVNCTPTFYGEKIVLRLLDMTTDFNLDSINLESETTEDLINASNGSNGVVVVSGATGSGKTRTLFSLLNSLDKERRSIVTLEDPVEYTFDGINQIQIKKGISFADGLRAVLRQDPDVILIGEIRDFETADLCFKAAATGHIVLSTLHANSSTKVIERLQNMGVPKYVIKSNLVLSAAQRLLKVLCDKCSIKPLFVDQCHETNNVSFDTNRNEGGNKKQSECHELLKKELVKTVNEKGCKHCTNGIKGRMPVMEYLTRKELKEDELKPKESLFEKCLKLANKGIIDYREIYKYEYV